MSRISTGLSSPAVNQPFDGASEAINDIDLGTFLRLMIAELQNQDPLNPLDNKDMLAQISQIREVGATAPSEPQIIQTRIHDTQINLVA